MVRAVTFSARVLLLQLGCEFHRVSDDGVLQPVVVTNRADHQLAATDRHRDAGAGPRRASALGAALASTPLASPGRVALHSSITHTSSRTARNASAA